MSKVQTPNRIAAEELPWLKRVGLPCAWNVPLPAALFGNGFDFPG